MSRYIPTRKRQRDLGIGQIPNHISVYFHRNNLLKIKQALGTKCTSVSHVEYPKNTLEPVLNEKGKAKTGMLKLTSAPSKHGVIAKFGKEKPIVAMLNGTPNDIKSEYYVQLKNDMTDAASKRGLL